MPGVLYDLEPAVAERVRVGGAVGGGNDAVAVAPDGQDGDPDSRHAAHELGVVHAPGDGAHRCHVGLGTSGLFGRHIRRVHVKTIGVVPGVFGHASCVEGKEVADRVTIDADADGVDQDETGDQAGAVAHRHLGADPASQGGADDEDVVQVIVFEVLEVGQGEVIDSRQPGGTIGPVPARMGRGDRVHRFSEVVGDARHRERAAAAVEDEDGPPGAGFREGDFEVLVERNRGSQLVHVAILYQHVYICKLT